MSIALRVENVRKVGQGVWLGRANPRVLRNLGNSEAAIRGSRSVVLVTGARETSGALEIDPEGVYVAGLGRAEETVFVATDSASNSKPNEKTRGDEIFLGELQDLPGQLSRAGTELIRQLRQEFSGQLVFHPKSKKYVNRPDNFFVFRVQPVDESIRVMVYGKPDEHDAGIVGPLGPLSPEMGSYASFKVRGPEEVEHALKIIRHAYELKQERHGRGNGSHEKSAAPREPVNRTRRATEGGQAAELRRQLRERYEAGDVFTSKDLYELVPHFKALYPSNRNLRAMLRAKLQELRDQGLVEFVRRGRYRLLKN